MEMSSGHYWDNRNAENTSCSGYQPWIHSNVSNQVPYQECDCKIKKSIRYCIE